MKLLEDYKWEGNRSFDAHAYRTADREEVWDFVDGCMRTYLILKEKVQRFNQDAEIQGILKDLHKASDSALPPGSELVKTTIDPAPLMGRKYHHEKLDQLLQEVLLGVR